MPRNILHSVLGDGRKVGLACLEIIAFPSISILPEFGTSQEAHAFYKHEMMNLLTQISRSFTREFGTKGVELSLELAFLTRTVQNQPYVAGIRSFFNVRVIGGESQLVDRLLASTIRHLRSLLRAERYASEELSEEAMLEVLHQINADCACSLIKEDRLHTLQSPTLYACYDYDRLGTMDDSFRRLFYDMTQYPDCYISFQLIPTRYTAQERELLINSSQVLSNLLRGVPDQRATTVVAYSAAKSAAETYQYYADHAMTPLFSYAIYVQGPQTGVNDLSQTLLQILSGSEMFTTALQTVAIPPQKIAYVQNPCTMPWILQGEIIRRRETCAMKQAGYDYTPYKRFSLCITAEEASVLFHLPIGDRSVGAGLNIEESHYAHQVFRSDVINTGDIEIGFICASARNDYIAMNLRDFTKHMLVTGTPGSGKTTFLVGLLDRLWRKHHIPFLVIEPAKNEYRALIHSIPELQVFTPGKSDISPFIYNPFLPPKNVRLETYKATLMTAFSAAVSMSTPLDKIFEDSIANCYGDHQWFDHDTSDSGAEQFNIQDFISCFQKTFEKIGYTGDAQNIGRAGFVRLRSLAHLFDCYCSIPIEHLLEHPTLIELSALESSDQKALIIALLLLAILNYVNANQLGDGQLHNIILLEEAHVLMDASRGQRPGEADPAATAQKLITRMLAEIRAYGVGMILADQSPRKVGADVVALTDAKLSFRIVEAADRQMIADSTGMTDAQQLRLSRLKPGEAMLYFGRLDVPEEIRISDYRKEHQISISLRDNELKHRTRYWSDHATLLKPYPECKLAARCAGGCPYRTRTIAKEIARRIHQREFPKKDTDLVKVQQVIQALRRLIAKECRQDTPNDTLYQCVLIHLLRLLRYNQTIYRDRRTEHPEILEITHNTAMQILSKGVQPSE